MHLEMQREDGVQAEKGVAEERVCVCVCAVCVCVCAVCVYVHVRDVCACAYACSSVYASVCVLCACGYGSLYVLGCQIFTELRVNRSGKGKRNKPYHPYRESVTTLSDRP